MALSDELTASFLPPATGLTARPNQLAFVPDMHIVSCHLPGILVPLEGAIFVQRVIGSNLLATSALNALLFANLAVLSPLTDHERLGTGVALDLCFEGRLLWA